MMLPVKMRAGTWDDRLAEEAAIINRYRLPDAFDDGAVVVDVGAHIGAFSIAAAERGARVLAFEPDPENFAMLMDNTADFRRNGRIQVEAKAVWRSDWDPGRLRFNPWRRWEGDWGLQTGAGTCCVDVHRPDLVEVATVPLDSVLSRIGAAAMLKLDCEFAEYPILLTSRELHRVQTIAAEWHEVPGPLAAEARVGSVDHFRGEHLIGALLCQGFEVDVDRKHEFHGHFWAHQVRQVILTVS
jgi:FkbM family methyltransferase